MKGANAPNRNAPQKLKASRPCNGCKTPFARPSIIYQQLVIDFVNKAWGQTNEAKCLSLSRMNGEWAWEPPLSKQNRSPRRTLLYQTNPSGHHRWRCYHPIIIFARVRWLLSGRTALIQHLHIIKSLITVAGWDFLMTKRWIEQLFLPGWRSIIPGCRSTSWSPW